jgi:hypothetical protein
MGTLKFNGRLEIVPGLSPYGFQTFTTHVEFIPNKTALPNSSNLRSGLPVDRDCHCREMRATASLLRQARRTGPLFHYHHSGLTTTIPDKHTVFRVNKPDASGGSGMTQVARSLAKLNIELLRYSSCNVFLPAFLGHFKRAFRRACSEARELHRSLRVKASQLTDIVCHREQRHVGQQLTLAYDRIADHSRTE